MSNKRISDLTLKTTPTTLDLLPIVDVAASDNKKITIGTIPVSTPVQSALNSKVNFITSSSSPIPSVYYGDIDNPFDTFTISDPTIIYGNVNCSQLNIDADLEIKGNLVADNVIVQNFASVIINGSTTLGSFNYTTADLLYSNNDVSFYGPVKISDCYYRCLLGGAQINFYEDAVINQLYLVDPSLDSASSNSVSASKNLYCADIYAHGVDCNTNVNGTNQAGNGGSVSCENLFASNVYLDGGNNNFTPIADVISAGNAGSLNVTYNTFVSSIYASGGSQNVASALGGSAGNGGNISSRRLNFSSLIQANGGNCLSDADFPAGNGGYITGTDEIFGGSIIATSGSRTSSQIVSTQASPSTVASGGNITLLSLNLNGGDMTAPSGSVSSGNGGILSAGGDLALRVNGTFTLSGGNGGASVSGGNGGQINLQNGFMVGGDISLNGGNGGLSPGYAGLIQVRRGIDMGAINLVDGSGTPTNATSGLQFNGNAVIRRINFANRTNSRVRPLQNGEPAILRCFLMPTKNTIATASGVESVSLTSLLTSNIFMTNASGTWIRIAGVTI